MLTLKLLNALNFEPEDIIYILEKDRLYGDIISKIASDYMSHNTFKDIMPYETEEFYQRRNRVAPTLKHCAERCKECDNEYVIYLLFWLYCIPFVKERYDKHGFSETVFYDTMSDLSCKTRECKKNLGKCGVSLISGDWFCLLFDFRVFALGRLQYYCEYYDHNDYKSGDYELKQGDVIYSCHIPSTGKLTEEMCMESLATAYNFLKHKLNSPILPVVCKSWLLYPPYVNEVFIKGRNMVKFAELFDITEVFSSGREFLDCPRVFRKGFTGSTEGFPSDNELQRNFIKYIESGRDFGYGFGIILYDGEKKQIINKKS